MDQSLKDGDFVLVISVEERRKKTRKVIKLKSGNTYFTHLGSIPHDKIIGKLSGTLVSNDKGIKYTVFRATYNDYVMALKRKAQIIYPKDIAALLLWGDIYQGLHILEAGLGEGALSIAILRLLCGSGSLTTYEIREDFFEEGSKNIVNFFKEKPTNHNIILGDIYNGFNGVFDRIFLDLPEPWHVLKYMKSGLLDGGIVISYIPTVLQVKTYIDTMQELGYFADIEVFENIKRPWHVKGLSVRPETWMYNFSAFIVYARKRYIENTGGS
jgi:tRNA (adenine57-N1/adenine58-N1)-methyltransferase